MKKSNIIWGVAFLTLAASCAQEDVVLDKESSHAAISYKVDVDGMTRAVTGHAPGGKDITDITVSAWVLSDASELPSYGSGNTGNAPYFLNDKMKGENGVFNYDANMRYWPSNGATLDFFAVVDNDKFPNGEGGYKTHTFGFSAADGKPGLDGQIVQSGLDMPDLLFARTFNQTREDNNKPSQEIMFDFKHAFAKVVVTAEVRNKNLHVVITDMDIVGIYDKGNLTFPHKTGAGTDIIINEAQWTNSADYTTIKNLMTCAGGVLESEDPKDQKVIALDLNPQYGKDKDKLLGDGATENDFLVIPAAYNGRNGNGTNQTYLKLMGYAYNIADADKGFDQDTDMLIHGEWDKKDVDKSKWTPLSEPIIIPIEFDWKMGTINRYNIIFDCKNGGATSENPNDHAFIQIGYEVEVNKWVTGETIDKEYIELPSEVTMPEGTVPEGGNIEEDNNGEDQSQD